MSNPFKELAEELRNLLVEERKAIAALDHEKLAWIADNKVRVSEELERQPPNPEHRAVLEALGLEARANAMLAAAAAEAVRALLGRESTGYDRRARRLTASAGRVLVSY